MHKIRLIPIDKDDKERFEVYIPGMNREYPIGRVWYDLMKNRWMLQPYFIPLTRDELKKGRLYEGSMKAARMLKSMFERVECDFEADIEADIDIGIEDTDPMYQVPLFDLDSQNTGSD